MDIANTAWWLNSTDFIEFIPHNLLISNNSHRGTWSTDENTVKFNIGDCIYTGTVINNTIDGINTLYTSKWDFEAVKINKINQFYLERLPYTIWLLHDADKDKNKIKFQFDIHHKISGEFSSWSFNDDGSLTIKYDRYNVVYEGKLNKRTITGTATNSLNEKWGFKAERLGVNLAKRAEYKYVRNQFIEANNLYALHFDHFGYKPSRYSEIYLKNYLTSILKAENPDIKLDRFNPIYNALQIALTKYRNELKSKAKLTGNFVNGYGIYSYHPENVLNFGIHKGETINQIIEISPSYIIWCVLNLDRFALTPSLFLHPNLKKESGFVLAIENNFIKHLFKSIYISDISEESYPDDFNVNYSWEDAYKDGGGGDEWSDPTEYW